MERAPLTASEIGTYAFCPEAWHLQRRRAARSLASEQRLRRGTAAHAEIGRRTDRLLRIERIQQTALVAVLLLTAGLVLLAAIAPGVRP